MLKANANRKSLNAIFGGIEENQFRYVTTCDCAKNAWDILQRIHEDTNLVKISKLKMLSTIFENLKMREEETIIIFNSKLMDIANQAFQLGKKYFDKILVQKTLRSLLRRFDAKVVAIEEGRDITTMRLDELMGSLQAYDMNLNPGRREEDIVMKAEATRSKELQHTIVTEDKAKDIINNRTTLPTVIKKAEVFRNFNAFASPVTTSIATPGESDCEVVTENDLLHGYELMLNKIVKMFTQNKSLAKELKVCQEKLNDAEKTINYMKKGKAKIDEISFKASVTQHNIETIKETSGVKKGKVEAGDKGFLMNYKECQVGHVTFGDGQKGQVVGKGTLMVPGYPRLKNILHVEGLKDRCVVYDEAGQYGLIGSRSSDNCYLLEKLEVCYNAFSNITEIWHQKLIHLNFINLMKIAEIEAVKGVPKLTKKEDGVCRPCQLGKKSRATHKVLQHIVTKRVSNWVDILKEKSDTFEAFKNLCMQLQNEKVCQIGKIVRIRNDHEREFENAQFAEFSKEHGIHHEFSATKTP
ncbi:uncharacterized protein LOC120258644 [Dioscorea cayenensis subsp. rotundata]|uniref:Uncharacterized protein LOC120258644 n=1 Tax=Dioscorea cayennensis subsp. rotundata TaxID=55577 RepID=A0AB40B5H7_DIOCR|nr:uncharacterized protein LOC120258644 [Dioscorea cayenensis subsp. rotundata]